MHNSFNTKTDLSIKNKTYQYFNISHLSNEYDIHKLPFCLKILLENLLRCEDGISVTKQDINMLLNWSPTTLNDKEIAFTPSRVILQDFTGVPTIVDLAAMRQAMKALGGNPKQINPLAPVELVIDHSVMVDYSGNKHALEQNAAVEFERNKERYSFLRWGQTAFQNFKVVPPDTGIVHQVNLEYLARVVFENANNYLYPDTLVGTDSHTTMINGIGVLGWGVGGIEAEAAMLGQPITMLIPEVIGFKLMGKLKEGTTATDLVLTVVEMLRKKNVVGKFVEFYGEGLDNLPIADRATIANMAPEFGATCAIFPIDDETLKYLSLTARSDTQLEIIKTYAKAQGLFRHPGQAEALYNATISLDLNLVEPSIAGPKRPQDRIALKNIKTSFELVLKEQSDPEASIPIEIKNQTVNLNHGSIVIAAITSCTNTSNPDVMIAAGLVAKKAFDLRLMTKPWVKTSLAPGSQVVTDYLDKGGLSTYLDAQGFHLVGYGCTTCIGNSGPLDKNVSEGIKKGNLSVAAILSGNRNFEGRIHPEVKNAYLASPPLVVAFALAGTMNIDIFKDPIGHDKNNNPIHLKDIWPTREEIQELVKKTVQAHMFTKRYADVFLGDKNWQDLIIPKGELYEWDSNSTYVKYPPYFDGMSKTPPPKKNIENAYILALFGDSVTTDHISPAGNIAKNSPAGLYLQSLDIKPQDFNSYGARRGNHEVMIRGTFANIRLRNLLLKNIEGGFTIHHPSKTQLSIYEASQKYLAENHSLIIISGKEYGTGSSRDWAAKGTRLLGVRAVIAESFERIHRSNLVGMGVLPLEFKNGENAQSLQLTGFEQFTIEMDNLQARSELTVFFKTLNNENQSFKVLCRIDTPKELEYFEQGGILQYMVRQLLSDSK